MSHVAFIGLGKMGTPMVMNLLKNSYRVSVFDVMPEAITPCVAAGAIAAESVAAAVKSADMVITMLQTGEQVHEVCLGDQGIFSHLHPGALYIDSSSIDVKETRHLHAQAEKQGIAMLDAPVSGGVKGAEAGTLTLMVGGKTADFERSQPILSVLGKVIVHAGPAGNGQAAKICNNMILGISMIAISEAFCLGEKLGLSAEKLFEISSQASGQCWAMTHYCPVPNIVDNVPANHDYRPGFTAAMMLKDLNLSQSAAKLTGSDTELAAKATAIYQHFVDNGQDQIDFSGIITMICNEQVKFSDD